MQIKVIVKLINIRFLVTIYTAMSVTTQCFAFGSCFSLYYFSLFNYSLTVNQDSIPSTRKISCLQCTDLVLGTTQSPIPRFCLGQEVNLPCPSISMVLILTVTNVPFKWTELFTFNVLHVQSNLTTRWRWMVGHMPPLYPLGKRMSKNQSKPVAFSIHKLSCHIS